MPLITATAIATAKGFISRIPWQAWVAAAFIALLPRLGVVTPPEQPLDLDGSEIDRDSA